MGYYFYNTDADYITQQPRPRFPLLIAKKFAATGGPYKFGEKLGQLARQDTLLMYENKVGVVAVGHVREEWDREKHKKPMYYTLAEMQRFTGPPHEYRIAVDWFLDLSKPPYSPVSLDELRSRLGYTPRGTVQKVVAQQAEVIRLISSLRFA